MIRIGNESATKIAVVAATVIENRITGFGALHTYIYYCIKRQKRNCNTYLHMPEKMSQSHIKIDGVSEIKEKSEQIH